MFRILVGARWEDLVGEENVDWGLLLAPAFPFQALTDAMVVLEHDLEPCAIRNDTDSVSVGLATEGIIFPFCWMV